MIVCKFGGSSVDGPQGLERVAGIVRARLAARPVVVVSAMGKTTRRLLDAAEAAAGGGMAAAMEGFAALAERHRAAAEAAVPAAGRAALAAALAASFDPLEQELAQLARERRLTARAADAVAAHGELLASRILALALPAFGVEAAWIDARLVMVTDGAFGRALPLYEETGRRLRAAILPLVERGVVPVVGGYIGATRDGVVTTLGKEGSDFSAAIVGAALGADEIQLWTDVDGLLTADPRLVAGAVPVAALSFAEALELASSGAKKPHPGTLGPASRGGVPIRILNSLAPHVAGTRIGPAAGAPEPAGPPAAARGVRSLACRAHDHLLYVSPAVAGDTYFIDQVAAVVERLRPALLVVRLDGEAAQLALEHADRLEEAVAALTGAGGRVGVARGRGVVSLVAAELADDAALVARVLAAAAAWEPHLVIAGAAAPAVRCLVEVEDLPTVAAALHERLFGEQQWDGQQQGWRQRDGQQQEESPA